MGACCEALLILKVFHKKFALEQGSDFRLPVYINSSWHDYFADHNNRANEVMAIKLQGDRGLKKFRLWVQ